MDIKSLKIAKGGGGEGRARVWDKNKKQDLSCKGT